MSTPDEPRAQGTPARGLVVVARERSAVVRDWLARRREPAQWLTGVLFAIATALLSGAIALLPGALDFAAANGWDAAWQTWTLRLTTAFGLVGSALLGAAASRWHLRVVVLSERGTAYVIEEQAITWRHEEKASVLAAITGGFASVLRVPGPGELGENWNWQADPDAAALWDARADQLVHSFWAVHFNDDQVTSNAVFTWAPWPVAMAFGARATARRPGLVLHVRQRPSAGGALRRVHLNDEAHDFLRGEPSPSLPDRAPQFRVEELTEHLAVTIVAQRRPGSANSRRATAGVLLLVVRVTHGPVGPIGLDLTATRRVTLDVCRPLADRVIPVGAQLVPVAEWRLSHADPAVMRSPHLPWGTFPGVAEAIAGWIVRQAAEHPDRVVLLATRIPQEIAVGLGVQLGQRSMELDPDVRWPRRVYPIFHVGERLVVPYLRLGADSVPAQRDGLARS